MKFKDALDQLPVEKKARRLKVIWPGDRGSDGRQSHFKSRLDDHRPANIPGRRGGAVPF
jgi:hypothetical protein